MRYLKFLFLLIMMIVLCSCSALEDIMVSSGQSEIETYAGETQTIVQTEETTVPVVENVVSEQFEKAVEGGKVPNLTDVITKALKADPKADIASVVREVLESGNYDLAEVSDTDGSDNEAMDALEVQLAEVLDSVLADIEIESVSTPWGVLGK